jgi:hypothetical protein
MNTSGNKTKKINGEKGQALILVLIFFVLGSLTLVPVLNHLSTALKTNSMYEEKTDDFYAADSGIEDGIWRIKYNGLQALFGDENYNYDYTTNATYQLNDDLNDQETSVTIQNVWFPSNVNLDDPGIDLTPDEAMQMIESDKLVVSGSAGAIPGQPYHIKIDFTPDVGDNLTVKNIGVWLPQGFSYTDNSSNIEIDEFTTYYPDSVDKSEHQGGQAVVWNYNLPYPLFADFPDATTENGTITIDVSFEYSPPPASPFLLPTAIAWIVTDMDPSSLGYTNPNDVPLSWDTDTRYYRILSEAGETSIEAYSSKCELRALEKAITGDYVAIGNSLMSDTNYDHIKDYKYTSNDFTLTTIPSDADAIYAYLYWTGWRADSAKIDVFTDTCSDLTKWTVNSPTAWSAGSGHIKGDYVSGGTSAKTLTKAASLDLSSYVPGSAIAIWKQATPPAFTDTCENILTYWTNGSDWSGSSGSYRAFSSAVDSAPSRLLTLTAARDLSYTNLSAVTLTFDTWENTSLGTGDGLDVAFSADNGATWSDNISVFRDDIGNSPIPQSIPVDTSYLTSGFKMRFKVVGCNFSSNKYIFIDNIKITPSYSSSDKLKVAASGDGGSTWSEDEEVLSGDIGASLVYHVYYIPENYHTSSTKIRFTLEGFDGPGENCVLDDIKIQILPPDTSVTFKIDDTQVSFDLNGDPQTGGSVAASTSRVQFNFLGSNPTGFSYACYTDVSDLVLTYPIVPGEEHHTGNAKYTLGDVTADTGNHISYAGWSLIIVYFSPDSAGHYLYLRDIRDVFTYTGGNENLDFDGDGNGGGDITDFVIPEPIRDRFGVITETTAARITCFVGEGDDWLYGSIPNTDCMKITGQQSGNSDYLSNSASPDYNLWNSASPDMNEGIDIDTFTIPWEDDIFRPGDNSVHLDMFTQQDAWNLIYFIISVRSETIVGGTGHYVIHG